METNKTLEFFPVDVTLSAGKNWKGLILLNTVGIVMWALLTHSRKDHSIDSWLFLAGILLLANLSIILFAKQPIKLTLNAATGTLQYDYADFFLNEKSITVYLETAYFEYKPYTTKTGSYMRLLTYNNYFKNQVAIKATNKGGFNPEQLNTIAENIKNIQAKLQDAPVS